MMTSSKKPVACTVSFLSDETKHKFEVWIKRQGADGGFEERKRFAELESALAWASTALQGQVEAFREERRQFEQLKETASPRDRAIYFVTDPSQLPEAERMRRRREAAIAARTRQVGGHTFRFISVIEPERDRAESVREFMPQKRYRNKRGLPLHQYGHGPFCRFRIPRDLDESGVYALTVDDGLVYIGECQNLSERFNSRGYGTISPRNCYKGGQQTNCRINHLVLRAAKAQRLIELWFYPTAQRRSIEKDLIQLAAPEWNR